MNCPACLSPENITLEVRNIRRRLECKVCKHRWTTIEITAERFELLERLERHAAAMAEELGDAVSSAPRQGD